MIYLGWLVVLFLLVFVYKKIPVYTKQEVFDAQDVQQSYKFSGWFWYIHQAYGFIFMAACFATAVFLAYNFPALQRLVLAIPQSVPILLPENYMFVILPALFIAIGVAGICFLSIGSLFFPKFVIFEGLFNQILANEWHRILGWTNLTKNAAVKEIHKLSQNIDTGKFHLKMWRETVLVSAIIWATAGLVMAFSLDTYTLVLPDKIVTNTFFEMKPTEYSLADVEESKIFVTSIQCRKRVFPCVVPHFEVRFKDGKTRDLWSTAVPVSTMRNIYTMLSTKNMKIVITPPDQYSLSLLLRSTDPQEVEVGRFFEEIKNGY